MKKESSSMVPRRLGWLGLLTLLLWSFPYLGSAPALGIAIVLLLLPLLSLPVNLYLRNRVRFAFRGQTPLKKNTPGEILLTAENQSLLPILQFGLRVAVENRLTGQTQELRIHSSLWGRETQEIPIQMESAYSGRLRITIKRVVLYDVFGVLGLPRRENTTASLTVQPDTFEGEVTLCPGANLTEDSDLYSQERPGNDLSEPFRLREYVPGDSPRQIHWKLSGKLDRLIVKDPSLPIAPKVLLFWERTGESGVPALIDTQAEVVLSLSRALTEQGIPFTLGWNDTERNLCLFHQIRDTEDLTAVIPGLMGAVGKKEGVSGVELLLQTATHILCSHMVYLGEKPHAGLKALEGYGLVTCLLCGAEGEEHCICYSPQNYVQRLSYLEI